MTVSRKSVQTSLETVGGRFGEHARETILLHNSGKHLFEIENILEGLDAGGRVLDVGGGMGINLLCLRELAGEKYHLYLIDRFNEYTGDNLMGSADNGLAMMRQHGISVTDQDFFLDKKLPYESDYFDVVTVLDVIEHLPANPLALLSEIKRVLKPGGKVILGVPNAIGLAKFYKLIAGHHPYMGFDLWLKDQYFSHYREYSGKECEKMLAMTGFESSTIMSNEPLQTMTKNRYLDSKMSVISPGYLSLYMLYLGGKILKNRRPTIYCLGIKPE